MAPPELGRQITVSGGLAGVITELLRFRGDPGSCLRSDGAIPRDLYQLPADGRTGNSLPAGRGR